MKNIKEALEKYKKEIYYLDRKDKPPESEEIMCSIGFQDCADLLLPLVEALELIGNSRTLSGEDTASARHARQALSDLKAKLGVTNE